MSKSNLIEKSIEKINQKKLLLVFPITNKQDPPSLWFQLFPRVPMDWNWSEDGDNRVVQMWQLMKTLSDCRRVIYSKWYQNRATFFSNDFFTHMLAYQKHTLHSHIEWTSTEKLLLEILRNNSPMSTKELKAESGLKGKLFEAEYTRSLKKLFLHQYIVAYGEVEDGAFPSLAIGATETLYEEEWLAADAISLKDCELEMRRVAKSSAAFQNYFKKQLKMMQI